MSEASDVTFSQFVRQLDRRASLGDDDKEALRSLHWERRSVKASTYAVRAGEAVNDFAIIASGFAYRHTLIANGARQIVGMSLPGEPMELRIVSRSPADCNVQFLTDAELDIVPLSALRSMMYEWPRIANAILAVACVEMSILTSWMSSIGRRSALGRVAHLLCEFGARHDALGLTANDGYRLPMNQQQIGDATGLTAVHVNRMLKTLRDLGFVDKSNRQVIYHRWEPMREIANFREGYLGL